MILSTEFLLQCFSKRCPFVIFVLCFCHGAASSSSAYEFLCIFDSIKTPDDARQINKKQTDNKNSTHPHNQNQQNKRGNMIDLPCFCATFRNSIKYRPENNQKIKVSLSSLKLNYHD